MLSRAAQSKAPLDRAELDRLFAGWQEDRDEQAREELVTRFTPLVRKLVMRYSRSSEPVEDLMQVGLLGLLQALNRYDSTKGTAFTSFAVPTILGELKRHFRDHGWSTHVPRPQQEVSQRVSRANRALTAECGRTPTVVELAAQAELSVDEVCEGLQVMESYRSMSLDAPVSDGREREPAALGDTIGACDDGFDLVEAKSSLATVMSALDERERRLLSLRFGEELSQREIGARLGVSQMQVSRLLRRTLSRIRERAEVEAPELRLNLEVRRHCRPSAGTTAVSGRQ